MNEISVIIPAYNAEKTIARAVQSVLSSTIPVDVWVVNDGSTDGTAQVLKSLSANSYVHIIHQPNSGAYQARLNALKQVKTPYFGFVDADDTIESNMFERMLTLAKRENLDAVEVKRFGVQMRSGERNVLVERVLSKPEIFKEVVTPILWEGRDSSFIWDKLYRNQYDFAAFDPTNHVTNFDDLIFNLHFFVKVSRLGVINEPLYHYSETIGSAARKFRWKLVKDFFETVRIRRKMAKVYGFSPWGWMNVRWTVKNARNLVAIWVKSCL